MSNTTVKKKKKKKKKRKEKREKKMLIIIHVFFIGYNLAKMWAVLSRKLSIYFIKNIEPVLKY